MEIAAKSIYLLIQLVKWAEKHDRSKKKPVNNVFMQSKAYKYWILFKGKIHSLTRNSIRTVFVSAKIWVPVEYDKMAYERKIEWLS